MLHGVFCSLGWHGRSTSDVSARRPDMKRLATDERGPVEIEDAEASERARRLLNEAQGRLDLGNVALQGEEVGVVSKMDRGGGADAGVPSTTVASYQPRPDALRGSGDDGDPASHWTRDVS